MDRLDALVGKKFLVILEYRIFEEGAAIDEGTHRAVQVTLYETQKESLAMTLKRAIVSTGEAILEDFCISINGNEDQESMICTKKSTFEKFREAWVKQRTLNEKT